MDPICRNKENFEPGAKKGGMESIKTLASGELRCPLHPSKMLNSAHLNEKQHQLKIRSRERSPQIKKVPRDV